jgi:hypothetical protein
VGIGPFQGVKLPERDVDPTPSSAEFKERLELRVYFDSLVWAFVACSEVIFTLLFVSGGGDVPGRYNRQELRSNREEPAAVARY